MSDGRLVSAAELAERLGDRLDAGWVEGQIEAMFGRRDPRLGTWREIVAEVRGGT